MGRVKDGWVGHSPTANTRLVGESLAPRVASLSFSLSFSPIFPSTSLSFFQPPLSNRHHQQTFSMPLFPTPRSLYHIPRPPIVPHFLLMQLNPVSLICVRPPQGNFDDNDSKGQRSRLVMELQAKEVPQVHHSWSSLEPLALTPHEGHGRDHNAFAVAISPGIGGSARKTRREKTRRIGIRDLSRSNMIIVASFLSSAKGARPDRHRNCAPQSYAISK